MIWALSAALLGGDSLGRIAFPPDQETVLDAKRDLGAKGDGVADDTEALQKGIDLSSGYNQKKTMALYLPNGTYRLTKSLVVNNALGPWLYGESRDGVVLKLADGSKGVTAVLRTHPREQGPTSADWFMRNVRNLTVDVGDNPDCDGVRWYATNTGILKNVRVIGKGKVGVNAGFLDQSGPNLVQDVEVDGFETGLQSQWIWGQTLSRVALRNCRKVGLYVNANSVAAEDLTVENCPLPVKVDLPNDWHHWSGVLALDGADLRGAKPDGAAILNLGTLYARNVKTAGFKLAVDSPVKAITVAGPAFDEYCSDGTRKLFADAPDAALKLPAKPEPQVPYDPDPQQWVCANDFGAKAGDNQDDTDAIRKAIDSAAAAGKSTVYLRGCGGGDPNWYSLSAPVKVHGSVRMVLGLGWARLLGDEKKGAGFVLEDAPGAAATVKFQNIDSFGGTPILLTNRSGRTLVVESCGVTIVGDGTGEIFATDCPAHVRLKRAGQRMQARQLNPEGDSDEGLVQNAGGELRILGMKNEGRGVRIGTTAGGRTEVLGVFNYGPGLKADDKRPMFLVRDAALSVCGLRELAFGGDCWHVKVTERRGGETKSVGSDKEGGWIGWAHFSARPPAKP